MAKNINYQVYNSRIGEISTFLAEHSSRSTDQQVVIDEIIHKIVIPQKYFVIARNENKVVGTLMGILDTNGYLYLADIFVIPDLRRNGIATSMMFKIIHEYIQQDNVKNIWLQVEEKNTNALNLYYKLGLSNIYSYSYLRKTVG